jgi:hypothetical protein
LSLNDLCSLKIFLFTSFVVLFGNRQKSEDGIACPVVSWAELGVIELQPLVDGGSLCRCVTIVFSSFSGKVT